VVTDLLGCRVRFSGFHGPTEGVVRAVSLEPATEPATYRLAMVLEVEGGELVPFVRAWGNDSFTLIPEGPAPG